MQRTPSPLSDKIIFEDSKYPINIRPHQSFHPYDPQNPSSIFHEEVEIKLILEGDYTLMINGDIYTVHPGDIVVINPYEHHYTIDTGTHGAIYNLYMLSLDFLRIYNPHAPDLRYTLLGEKICFLNIIRQNKRLQHILLSAQYEMAEQKENWQLILNNLMIEFFVILFREYINSDRINNVQITSLQYYDNILPALVYINANYAAKINVDTLAELCGFSKYYFCRIFKQVTGQTIIDYINQYRLRLADYLIQTEKLTTPEIAKRCGFEDVNYFYRLYKKHFGHTRYNR